MKFKKVFILLFFAFLLIMPTLSGTTENTKEKQMKPAKDINAIKPNGVLENTQKIEKKKKIPKGQTGASAKSAIQSKPAMEFDEVVLDDGTVWKYQKPLPFDESKMDKAGPTDTATNLEMYEPLRNGRAIWDDYPAEMQPMERPQDFALGQFFQFVPEEQLDDDVIELGIGSFSINPKSPYYYENFLNQIRSWWDESKSSGLSMTKAPENETMGYYIVKLDRRYAQPDPDVIMRELEGYGIKFLGPVSKLTYYAYMSRAIAEQWESLKGIKWLGPYLPAYKINPDLGRVKLPLELAGLDEFEIRVLAFPGVDISWEITNLGGNIIGRETASWLNLYYVRINRFSIPALAQVEGIITIEEVSPLIFHNEITPSSMQEARFKAAGDRPYWRVGVDGRGQIAGVMDGEFQTANSAFATNCSTPFTWNSSNPTHRKVVYSGQEASNTPDTYCVTTTGVNHGTQTAGNIAGNPSDYNASTNPTGIPAGSCAYNTDASADGWPDLDGVARNAKLGLYNVSTTAGETTGHTALINAGAKVINKSYGYGGTTYDTTSYNVDNVLYGNQKQIIFTISAGNDGDTTPIGAPALAKNDITVGAVYQLPNLYTLTSFSSRGPETNNRMGPTLMAPGQQGGTLPTGATKSSSASCYSTSNTTVGCSVCSNAAGTSFSAPFTAGLVEIVRSYFAQGFYPTGSLNASNAFTPTGPLVKAALIAATDPVTNVGSRTGQAAYQRVGNLWGYGVPILKNVLPLAGNSNLVPGLKVWDYSTSQGIGGNGHPGPDVYTIKVSKSGVWPLRVALVWYDPPVSGNGALINDLNLQVISPTGKEYRGNRFTNQWSTTNPTTWDTINPTELVVINPAEVETGFYTIRVIAQTVTQNDPTYQGQTYSLLAAGDIVGTASVNVDKFEYTCADTVNITVRDPNDAHNATFVSNNVLITSSNGDSLQTTFTGSNNVYTASIQTRTGTVNPLNDYLEVTNGATITVTYNDGDTNPQTSATVDCQANVEFYGWALIGGCDEAATPPPFEHAADYQTEYYTPYLDNGEYIEYVFAFTNYTGADLTDAYVQLNITGTGASYIQILSTNPVYVGRVNQADIGTANFALYATGAPGLTGYTLNFTITSPADGYTTSNVIQVNHLLQTNDYVTEQARCYQHTAAEGWTARNWTGMTSCSFTLLTTCGIAPSNYGCNCTSGTALHTHKTAACTTNFPANCVQTLYTPVWGPVNTGIHAGTGQPWYWAHRRTSFWYRADAVTGTSYAGAWGWGFDPWWNLNSVPPTGETLYYFFPLYLFWYLLDNDFTWCTTAGTTCDDLANSADCQIILEWLNPDAISDRSDSTDYWSAGHVWLDADLLTGGTVASTLGIELDDDYFVWDEYHAGAQTGGCTGGQCGVPMFNEWIYSDCDGDIAEITVLDSNASTVSVTVTAVGTGDSETFALTGTAPTFKGSIPISFNSNGNPNDGKIYALPYDTLVVTYNDANDGTGSPCTRTDEALTACYSSMGDFIYVSNSLPQTGSNGDGDVYADPNETIVMDITIQNNMSYAVEDVVVTIDTTTPNLIDCIIDNTARYGTVNAGASATNPTSDRFTFHVAPTVNCTDWENPPTATFIVNITGKDFTGSRTLQTFQLFLDLDPLSPPVSYNRTWDFNAGPGAGWTVQVGPGDDDGVCSEAYVNDFHWCAACGNASGGYGAWVGNNAFNTAGQTYSPYSDSVLLSPILYGSSTTPTLAFYRAYQIEGTYDGGAVYYKNLSSSTWTSLNLTGMVAFNPSTGYCNPLDSGNVYAWSSSTASTWTAVAATALTGTANNYFQVRFRLGSDSAYNYAGFGVDTVTINNLGQNRQCDTKTLSLPACSCNMVVDVTPDGTSTTYATSYLNFTANVTGGYFPYTYQWLEDGNPIPGATSQTLSITKPTAQTHTYNVRVTDYNGNCVNRTDATSSTGTWTAAQPMIEYDSTFQPVLTQVCGDGDQYVEKGEQWNIYVRLKNTGVLDATNVQANLSVNPASTITPTITGNPGNFGNIPVASKNTNISDKWMFEIPAGAACPSTLIFDLTNIVSTGYSYPNKTAFITIMVNPTYNETGTANPAAASKNSQSADFSPAFTSPAADTATLSYTYTYTAPPNNSVLFGPDDFADLSNWTVTSGQLASVAKCGTSTPPPSDSYLQINGTANTATLTNPISTVGWTNVRVRYHWTVSSTQATIYLEYSTNGSTWTQVASFNASTTWQCSLETALGAGAEGQSTLYIRFRVSSTQSTRRGYVDYVSIVANPSASINWTNNVKVELKNAAGTWYTLKNYGQADANPYNVASYYSGSGTYTIRVTENIGGSADLNNGSLNVQLSQCNYTNCGGGPLPPPPVMHQGANAAKFTKGAGNTINVTYDNVSCSSDHVSILYNNIGTWTGYAGCALANGGNTGSTSFDSTGQTSVWYNIVWVNSSNVGGHPGFSSTGSRTWSAAGYCGITSQDSSDNICD
ncbi:MAG: hypothetical protein WHV67_03495 [Thermoanaerobaculia bacterium]